MLYALGPPIGKTRLFLQIEGIKANSWTPSSLELGGIAGETLMPLLLSLSLSDRNMKCVGSILSQSEKQHHSS
jgi:hypothetical protein